MKDELEYLFERLETEGDVVMAEIYSRTSSHLFGIIHNIVPHDAAASTILKSVYAHVWTHRARMNRLDNGPMSYLRRTAHRLAVDFKAHNSTLAYPESAKLDLDNLDFPKLKKAGLSDLDLRILQRAYLQGQDIQDIAKSEGLEPNIIRQSLNATSAKILRSGS